MRADHDHQTQEDQGCTSMRNLHEHHIVFRSAGGSGELENRVTLCAVHHLRGVR